MAYFLFRRTNRFHGQLDTNIYPLFDELIANDISPEHARKSILVFKTFAVASAVVNSNKRASVKEGILRPYHRLMENAYRRLFFDKEAKIEAILQDFLQQNDLDYMGDSDILSDKAAAAFERVISSKESRIIRRFGRALFRYKYFPNIRYVNEKWVI